ncbi:hypothetical protein [Bacteroides oleiciplenus]|uniref:hypothetical protein n=1 Tax=Bacteroides oleiciplenus TaxID=626931 RepID=UPI0026DB8BF8|nr:hypothetical protein [Bacteroides oleiciplenus]
MTKLLILGLCMCAFIACNRTSPAAPSAQTGVWVSDDAELLLTDSVMLYFERQPDSTVLGVVKLGDLVEDYALFRRDTVLRSSIPDGFQVGKAVGNEITVNGKTLVKAEEVKSCAPYDMPPATDASTIADRLTEWRCGVGAGFDAETGSIMVEANTSNNMFIYCIMNGMYYLRAARIANTPKGTLFFQNIRVMKNPNTGENTVYFAPDNKEVVLGNLDVDMGAFKPDACYFSPDGGVYWSYVSHTADQIVLNGCGETYYVNRQTVDKKALYEWIKPQK